LSNDLYSTPEKRLDTILGDASFWSSMQRAKASDEGVKACATTAGMIEWFRDMYGIQMLLSDSGIDAIHSTVEIVDEQKYIMFLLKWS
jgi:hypothetical protein